MQGKITIEMDFDQNTPYIKVISVRSSTDLRDKTLNRFFELLGGKSLWANVIETSRGGGITTSGEPYTLCEWKIYPIPQEDLSAEADKMKNIAINGL